MKGCGLPRRPPVVAAEPEQKVNAAATCSNLLTDGLLPADAHMKTVSENDLANPCCPTLLLHYEGLQALLRPRATALGQGESAEG